MSSRNPIPQKERRSESLRGGSSQTARQCPFLARKNDFDPLLERAIIRETPLQQASRRKALARFAAQSRMPAHRVQRGRESRPLQPIRFLPGSAAESPTPQAWPRARHRATTIADTTTQARATPWSNGQYWNGGLVRLSREMLRP